jgi:endoglucanase
MVRVSDDAGLALGEMNGRLGRGISFGNALDTLREGDTGFRLRERYFADVRDAGFDTVRLPVKWSAHAGQSPPYTISPALFERVDWAIGQALGRDLNIVLNVHHYDELNDAPREQRARFLGLWRQIAARYASWPGRLYFELLNEPRAAMTAREWNELIPAGLAVIRERDPGRAVIVGPARMNDIAALPELELPADDRLVVTVHYYAPLELTHQGAPWRAGADQWLGTTWGGDADRHAVRDDLAKAASWAQDHGRPLFIGEFGCYERADMAARRQWTRFVRLEAEQLGLSWCYWEFGTDFGAFDPGRNAWREPLRDALLGDGKPLSGDGGERGGGGPGCSRGPCQRGQ